MFKDEKEKTKLSKLLSLILRHEPSKIGLAELEPAGYVPVALLLERLNVTREDLDMIVEENNKQRFAYDPTGTRIRANQGHSVPVDLQLSPDMPPDVLYHGTPEKSVAQIRQEGLRKMARHAVHLSPDIPTATAVGARRGRPIILQIDAAKMHADGHVFYRSENGVWLTDEVPPEYIH